MSISFSVTPGQYWSILVNTDRLEEDEIDMKEHKIDFEMVIKHKEVRVELM